MNKRNFILGDEWVYSKIYTSENFADKNIVRDIAKIVFFLSSKEMIQDFHFVRYHDPHFHIRFRLKLSNENYLVAVTDMIRTRWSKYVEGGLIHSIEYATYSRELERYGIHTITSVERLFTLDTRRVLKGLNLLEGQEYAEEYRVLFGLLLIDTTLNSFGYDLNEKRSIMEKLNRYLRDKYGWGGKVNSKIIDKAYRDKSNLFISWLRNDLKDEIGMKLGCIIKDEIKEYEENTYRLKAKFAGLERIRVASDLFHMSMNRLFSVKNNYNEMIMYIYLYKAYTAMGYGK